MAEIDLGKVVGPQGQPGAKGDTGKEGPQGPPGPEGVVDGNSTITFVTPEAYQEPQSGDSIANLFGRFKRWILNLQDNLGPLSSLKTPDKSSAVAAVNANYDSIAQIESDVGNPTDLTTDAKEIVGAVNELNSDLDNIATEVKTVNNTFGYGTFSNGYVSIGKTVCVSFQVLLATNIAAGKVLCSGLPKPLSELAIINVYDSSASTYSRAKVTYDGAVYVETTHNSGASLLINGSYVAK